MVKVMKFQLKVVKETFFIDIERWGGAYSPGLFVRVRDLGGVDSTPPSNFHKNDARDLKIGTIIENHDTTQNK